MILYEPPEERGSLCVLIRILVDRRVNGPLKGRIKEPPVPYPRGLLWVNCHHLVVYGLGLLNGKWRENQV